MNICEKGNKYLYLTLFYSLFIRGPLGRLKLLFLPPVLPCATLIILEIRNGLLTYMYILIRQLFSVNKFK